MIIRQTPQALSPFSLPPQQPSACVNSSDPTSNSPYSTRRARKQDSQGQEEARARARAHYPRWFPNRAQYHPLNPAPSWHGHLPFQLWSTPVRYRQVQCSLDFKDSGTWSPVRRRTEMVLKKKRHKKKNRRLTAVAHVVIVNLVRLVVRNLVRNARCCGIRNAWCWDPMNACFLLAKRKGFC
jgi:hypothetical protein